MKSKVYPPSNNLLHVVITTQFPLSHTLIHKTKPKTSMFYSVASLLNKWYYCEKGSEFETRVGMTDYLFVLFAVRVTAASDGRVREQQEAVDPRPDPQW